jgi:hypothetical protein
MDIVLPRVGTPQKVPTPLTLAQKAEVYSYLVDRSLTTDGLHAKLKAIFHLYNEVVPAKPRQLAAGYHRALTNAAKADDQEAISAMRQYGLIQ